MVSRRRNLTLGGLKQVADQLGISRSSVTARRKHSDFPKPLAELACGPIWDLDEIYLHQLMRHGDPNAPDFFLDHPDPYGRVLEGVLRGLPPE
jgi:hypothetical protein